MFFFLLVRQFGRFCATMQVSDNTPDMCAMDIFAIVLHFLVLNALSIRISQSAHGIIDY